MRRGDGPYALVTRSPEETRELGRSLGGFLLAGCFVALTGDLGSGKTVLVQGIAEGLGCAGEVSSPSFVIVNEYRGRVPVYHIDLYRVADSRALHDLGYREYFYGDGVTLVEWADRAPDLLPPDRLDVSLELAGAEERRITLLARGVLHSAALHAAITRGRRAEGTEGRADTHD
jgi:tRNA threonylcarbamoyladenosine biosynthesis protein TsaE